MLDVDQLDVDQVDVDQLDQVDVDQEVKLTKTSSTVVAVEARANLKVDLFLIFSYLSLSNLGDKLNVWEPTYPHHSWDHLNI